MTYDLKPMKAPRAAGLLLKTFTFMAENPVTSGLLSDKLLGDAGILALRDVPTDDIVPVQHPLFAEGPQDNNGPVDTLPSDLTANAAPDTSFEFNTIQDYINAYSAGDVTPEAVAQRVIEATQVTENMRPAMRIFIAQNENDILEQAKQSTQRHAQGRSLGPLDGVPVAVKDELDQLGYPTTVGTQFLGTSDAKTDATVVARLRKAGALLIGKANMHELGMGVTGLNTHHGPARNPYNPLCATGGSSSGSAAAVASGISPLAVGADGGGSVRIPSALSGIVGLKATYGRISEQGAAPLCWTLAHVGPMGATVADVALGYMLMAGRDAADTNTRFQPKPHLNDYDKSDLKGLKFGVYDPWFNDAHPQVVAQCKHMLSALEEAGAQIVPIELPELGLLRTVHLVTIISEMATSHIQHYAKHCPEYGCDIRLNLALARRLQAYDYVHAQRHRVRLSQHFFDALKTVDCIVSPATARTAPILPEDALKTGESNLEVAGDILRYAQPANVTGLPAISFPAGYDDGGLPIGLQVMGRAWEEHTLLRIARVAEGLVVRKKPQVHHQILP